MIEEVNLLELKNDVRYIKEGTLPELKKDLKDIKYFILGSTDGKIGMYAKVEIMWGYRLLFVAAIISNLIGMLFLISLDKG